MRLFMLICLVATVTAGSDNWKQMRVKFGSKDNEDSTALWYVPTTKAEANNLIWHDIDIANDLNCQFVGTSQDDYGFTPCYDTYGHLSGAQLCHPMAPVYLNGPPSYSPTAMGTVEVKNFKRSLYLCSTFLLVDPTMLRAGGRPSVTSIGEGIWVRDTTNTETGYVKIPDNIDELLDTTSYTWQNCFPGMGKHYFYNFTTDFDCNKFYNWFLLGQDNDIMGIGLQLFGPKSIMNYDWYDFLPRVAAEMIAPNVNECLYDWIEEFGIISIHVFFQSDPSAISCSNGDSVTDTKTYRR